MITQIYTKETVQTGLAVNVDGVRIDYKRLPDRFAYEFNTTIGDYSNCKTENEAYEKIMQVVSVMESQSYDHGSEWRRTKVTVDGSKVERYGVYTVTVDFRIKDSY